MLNFCFKVRSVSNQVLPTTPRPQQIEIKATSPSKSQDTPKVPIVSL